jgi:hypothetical protein
MHGIPIDAIYLDYAKAFDTVPHRRLIRQVSSFGIQHKALGFIDSFLSDRRQAVRVNGTMSQWRPVLSGIPQGTVLGPILFSLFVSDIPSMVNNIISLFADDTKIYTTICNEDSHINLAEDLQKLQEWTQKMHMKFNITKCKVLHLGKNNPRRTYRMTDHEGSLKDISSTSHEKDLGVTIDNDLKFSTHIQTAVNKANRTLGCLRHTFKHMNKDIFVSLYKAMVRPHLEYASSVWSPSLKRDMDSIEQVQRRATRLIPELQHLPYPERLKSLNLPTLQYRRERTDIIETFKILNGLDTLNQNTRCPICPSKKMFQYSLSNRTRGHEFKLQHQTATGPRAKFLEARVTKPWNKLSRKTVSSQSVNVFKSNLEREWSNRHIKFNYRFSY